jgi:hypothetical protein
LNFNSIWLFCPKFSSVTAIQQKKRKIATEIMESLKPQRSDSLIIGCANRTLLQYSTRQRKLTKAPLEITPYEISALRTTADKKHLFIGDKCGNLKQIFLQTHGVTHYYG